MKNVIFADDHMKGWVVDYFMKACKAAGIEVKVEIVDDGSKLVEAVLKNNYDLVFTDGIMPTPGHEAVKQIRASGSKVPIYSTSTSKAYGEQIMGAGGTGILGVLEGCVPMEKIIAQHLKG